MERTNRVITIDVMRGLTLFLMLFVNDLFEPGVPKWMVHTPTNFDGMGLADWVFPGFLFMVGMAIPFALKNRLKKGDQIPRLLVHIIIRTVSLLIIGVLMMNVSRLNVSLTGMSENLWAILMYISVFLVWNEYTNMSRKFLLMLKGLGVIGLIILVIMFRAGTVNHVEWLQTGWWGILGLIGWGYFVATIVYLLCKDSMPGTVIFWILFVTLNILSQLELLGFLDSFKPVFGVIIDGNVPLIVVTGLIFSLLLQKFERQDIKKFIIISLVLGIVMLISGFILRNWFIISKNLGTPSWALICNGISILVFMFLYFIIDVLGINRWASIFKPAGKNSLTTYLAPDILYYAIWMFGIPIFFYKQTGNQVFAVFGSIVWAFAMIGLAAVLPKIGIKLKL